VIVIVVFVVMRRRKAKAEEGVGARPAERAKPEPEEAKAETTLAPELESDLKRSLGSIPKTAGKPGEPEVLEPEVEEGPPVESKPQDVVDVETTPIEPETTEVEKEADLEVQSMPMDVSPEETAAPDVAKPEPKTGSKATQTRYSYSYAKRGKGAKGDVASEKKGASGEALPELAPIDEEDEPSAPAKPRSTGSDKYKKKGKSKTD
jgi:hypothetical protein